MKKKGSKAEAQKRHARRRALVRHGINLSERILTEWIRKIREGKARLVEKQSNRITVFDVEHDGEWVRVVYDRQRGTLATVLPKGNE